MSQEILYFSYSFDAAVDIPGQEDVFAVDPDSGAVRRLTDDSSGLDFVSDRDPAWSPDRTKVAIHRAVSNNSPTVVVLDAATGDDLQVVAEGVGPVWLSDDRLVFRAAYDERKILASTLVGEVAELLLLPDGGYVQGLTWHPEQGLAFGYYDPGENPGMIGVVSAARVEEALSTGTGATLDDVVLVGRIGAGVVEPAWHPDGTRLAVSSYDPASGSPADTAVGIFDLQHRTYRRIVTPADGLVTAFASWSPDGTRLVFTRGEEDRWTELWLYDLATGSLAQLTDDHRVRFKSAPDW